MKRLVVARSRVRPLAGLTLLLCLPLACVGFLGDDEPAPTEARPDAPDPARCGDAIVQRELGESCDLGDANGAQGGSCSSLCLSPRCGDGVLQADRGEQCDEGDGGDGDPTGGVRNGRNGASCTSSCTTAGECGNGVVEDALEEECDTGPAGDDVDGACTTGCKIARCGDGLVQRWEECDPGPSGDPACTPGCMRSDDGCGAAVVAAGGGAGYVVRGDGQLLAFGERPDGPTPAPAPFDGPPGAGIAGLAAADGFLLARSPDGTLFGRGANEHGQLGLGDRDPVPGWEALQGPAAAEVAAGLQFGAFLTQDRKLWSFGANEFGKLGRGFNLDGEEFCEAADPGFADCGADGQRPGSCPCGCNARLQCNGAPCLQVACPGGSCSAPDCPLEVCESACANDLTDNCPRTVCVATPAEGARGFRFLRLSPGAHFVAGIRNDGRLYLWGRNRSRELGRTSYSTGCYYCYEFPQEVPEVGRVLSVAAGPEHVVVVDAEGTLWGFGWNGSGQLGPGIERQDKILPTRSSARPDAPGTRFVAVAAGEGDVSYAIDDAGGLYGFGDGSDGQAGPPIGLAPRELGPIALPAGERAVSVVAGRNFALVRTASGKLLSFGSNEGGRLGRSPERAKDPAPALVSLCP